jgi:hypothetical protein
VIILYKFIGKKGQMYKMDFIKLNSNCPKEEKNGVGPGSCSNDVKSSTIISKVHRDIPSISWLKGEREYAASRQMKTGRPIAGTMTSSFMGRLPVSMIKNLPGENKEHLNKEILSDYKAKPIFDSIKNEGVKEPITIFVNYKGDAYISEGNHRVHIADAVGLKDVPVDVRYFAGGELVNGKWNLKNFDKNIDSKYLEMEKVVNEELPFQEVKVEHETPKLPSNDNKDNAKRNARLALLKKKYGIKSNI